MTHKSQLFELAAMATSLRDISNPDDTGSGAALYASTNAAGREKIDRFHQCCYATVLNGGVVNKRDIATLRQLDVDISYADDPEEPAVEGVLVVVDDVSYFIAAR